MYTTTAEELCGVQRMATARTYLEGAYHPDVQLETARRSVRQRRTQSPARDGMLRQRRVG